MEGQNKTKRNLSESNLSLEIFLNLRPLDYKARLSAHHSNISFFEVISCIKRRSSVPVTCPVVPHRVGRGIVLLFHDHGTRRG